MITEYTNIITLITGIFMIIFAFAMSTKNLRSALIFKIIPFFLGISNLAIAAKLYNLI